jgi:hypothetical protein
VADASLVQPGDGEGDGDGDGVADDAGWETVTVCACPCPAESNEYVVVTDGVTVSDALVCRSPGVLSVAIWRKPLSPSARAYTGVS